MPSKTRVRGPCVDAGAYTRLRHPNLVMFLGACTIGEPLIILNEYMSGGEAIANALAPLSHNYSRFSSPSSEPVLCRGLPA